MKKIILLSVFLACILSCNKKDDCKEELVSMKHFETDYGCASTKFNLQIDLTNTVTIISSQESYDSQVTGTCHPTIDFSAYDLVIGKRSTANSNDTIMYDLRRTCPEKGLTLTVDIVQSVLTQPSTVTYHAIIPKLGEGESLKVLVTVR